MTEAKLHEMQFRTFNARRHGLSHSDMMYILRLFVQEYMVGGKRGDEV